MRTLLKQTNKQTIKNKEAQQTAKVFQFQVNLQNETIRSSTDCYGKEEYLWGKKEKERRR